MANVSFGGGRRVVTVDDDVKELKKVVKENTRKLITVDRIDWEPMYPRWQLRAERPAHAVIVRFTETGPCEDDASCARRVQDLQRDHITRRRYADIAWNWLIGGNGKVYEGTGWMFTTNKEDERFKHCEFKNYDIAYIGRTTDDVTADMKWCAETLIKEGIKSNHIKMDAEIIGDQAAIDHLSFTMA